MRFFFLDSVAENLADDAVCGGRLIETVRRETLETVRHLVRGYGQVLQYSQLCKQKVALSVDVNCRTR